MSAATTAHMAVLDTAARTSSSALRRRRLPFGRVAELLVGTVLVVLSLVPVARYLFVVAHRIGYPYELEWMEGGSVEVVHRVVLGQGIYGPPSMHFTPWDYTPLYFWVSAAVAEITGIGFTPLRLVSLTASLAVLWLLYRMVADVTSDRVAAVVAAGVYAATFRLAGAWADIGRVDSLFLAFTLWAIARSRRARTHRDGVIVGVLFFLSFFTKQDGLVVAAPVVAWLLVARRAAGVSALATLGGLVLSSTIVLDAFTHGWYQYYVFDELRSQGWVGENLRFFWQLSILKPFALGVGLVVVAGGALLIRERHRLGVLGSRAGFWMAAAAGLLGAAWLGRLHNGGFDDVLMPAYAAVALAFGGAVALLRRHPHVALRVAVSVILALVLAAQLHHIGYRVGQQIPTQADARAGATPHRADPPPPGRGARLRPSLLRRDGGQRNGGRRGSRGRHRACGSERGPTVADREHAPRPPGPGRRRCHPRRPRGRAQSPRGAHDGLPPPGAARGHGERLLPGHRSAAASLARLRP